MLGGSASDDTAPDARDDSCADAPATLDAVVPAVPTAPAARTAPAVDARDDSRAAAPAAPDAVAPAAPTAPAVAPAACSAGAHSLPTMRVDDACAALSVPMLEQGEKGALQLAGVFANLLAQATHQQTQLFVRATEGQRLLTQHQFQKQLAELQAAQLALEREKQDVRARVGLSAELHEGRSALPD